MLSILENSAYHYPLSITPPTKVVENPSPHLHALGEASPMKRILTPDQNQLILTKYSEGFSCLDLSIEFGVHRNTILKVLKKHLRARRQGSQVSMEDLAEMQALYQTGLSLEDVGQKFGLTGPGIRQLFIRHQIERRPPKRQSESKIPKVNLQPQKKPWVGGLDFPQTNHISNDPNTLLVNDLLVWKGNPLSPTYLRIVDEDFRDEIAKDIYNYIRQYDFTQLKFAEQDIQSSWKNLCALQSKLEVQDGITYVSNTSSSGNKIYRHYFPNILKVKGEKRPSIWEGLHDKELLWKIVRNRIGNTLLYNDDPKGIPLQYPMPITLSQLEIGAKNSGHCSMASVFKPSVAKALYAQYTKPGDKVLDYSMGFGGRLLGLMSLQQDNLYCGYDPNTETFSNLTRMSKDFGFKVEMKCCGSETDDLFNHQFNFIFSSPPYFSYEQYCEEETQSCIKYPEYQVWLEKYWRQTVKNCRAMMADDGIFAVNIGGNANPTMQMMERDLTQITQEEGLQLIDTWYMRTSKSHLSGKKGQEGKKTKLEGIFLYRKHHA